MSEQDKIIAACRFIGEHWTGDDGDLVTAAADQLTALRARVEELERANKVWQAIVQNQCDTEADVRKVLHAFDQSNNDTGVDPLGDVAERAMKELARLTAERDEANRLYQAAIASTQHRVGGSPITRHAEKQGE